LLIAAAHRQLSGGVIVLIWGTLNVHCAPNCAHSPMPGHALTQARQCHFGHAKNIYHSVRNRTESDKIA
jgi:hypothetical protein